MSLTCNFGTGSFDHSLNETGSIEPDTEDPQSDILEHDISYDSPPTPGKEANVSIV